VSATPTNPVAPNTPFIVFGDDWGRNVSSMQHVFRVIAARYPVVWVNGIGHRVPTFRRKDIARAVQKVRSMFGGRVAVNAASNAPVEAAADPSAQPRRIIHPRVLPWHHVGPVRRYNARWLRNAIARVMQEEGLTAPPIVVTGTPPSAPLIGELGEAASVYFCMDDFLHLPGVSPEMLGPLERELLEKVDVVVATAAALVESKRPRSGQAHYLPQGVNYEHFSRPQPVPAALRDLPRPLIGFAGGVTTPLDFELVRMIALAHPQASVVLVGPIGPDFPGIDLPNVHVLGRSPYESLPGFVQAFDVGLIPYVLNAHTLAVDPLKLLEYLAAGIPVVTTDLPEVRKYRDAVTIAAERPAFVAAVGAAVAATRPRPDPAAQAVARNHTWDRRADRLLEIISAVAAGQGRATLKSRP